MMRVLLVTLLSCASLAGCDDCADPCPPSVDVGAQCRAGAGCTVDGVLISAKPRTLELGPGQKLEIPLSLARSRGNRDGMTITYAYVATDERRLFAEIDGTTATIERYTNNGLPTEFVRISPTATKLTIWYEGAVARSLNFEAIDIACATTSPVCSL